MPELAHLEVIREKLAWRIANAAIATAEVRGPRVVRNLLGDRFAGQGWRRRGDP